MSARAGALIVLSCCFLVSALVRFGDVVAALPEKDESSSYINEPPARDTDSAGKDAVGEIRAPADVVAELKRQRKALEERAARLAAREQQLQVIEKRIKDRLAALKAERTRLSETAAMVHDAAGKDVRRLSEIYGTMKPKQAAQIFNQMAPSFAAGFMTEMQPGAAALIMANMDADKAYAISLLIAGRNVKPATGETKRSNLGDNDGPEAIEGGATDPSLEAGD